MQKRASYPGRDRGGLPVVIGNAMAKSGSHIIAQFLEGIDQITPLIFTDLHPIRTLSAQGRTRPPGDVLRDLHRLQNGDMGWGYLPSQEQYVRELEDERYLTYFAYRDPRDRIISQIMYAMNIHREHQMRAQYLALSSMEERIALAISGVPGMMPSIREIYDSYLGWLQAPNTLCIRFESLVGERQDSLQRMIDGLTDKGVALDRPLPEVYEVLDDAMSPKRSPTFRSGKSGEWRTHFTDANARQFKQVAGDLLVELGYEDSDDWGVDQA